MFLLKYENEHWPHYQRVAGIDEAGRGAWAGPVCAAAVIFEKGRVIAGVNDSKKLTAAKREELFQRIIEQCVSYGVGMVEPEVIDQINILEATKRAMLIAVGQLNPQPDFLFIDGNIHLASSIPQKPIIDGDALSHSIAAASILAKVSRDRFMIQLSQTYPEYGFDQHKGYGTKLHREVLKNKGCLPLHRQSYAPVSEFVRMKSLRLS